MHQQRLGRVAHAQPLALGVDGDRLGHVEIGGAVDVDVAVAGEVLDDRHLGFGRDAANQPFAAARNGHVDVLRQREKMADRLAIGRGDQLHGVGGQAGFGGRVAQQFGESPGSSEPPPCRREGSRRCRS